MSGQLVLSRKLGEAIRVGPARIVVLELGRTRMKLGIEAPADMPIVREELLLKREQP